MSEQPVVRLNTVYFKLMHFLTKSRGVPDLSVIESFQLLRQFCMLILITSLPLRSLATCIDASVATQCKSGHSLSSIYGNSLFSLFFGQLSSFDSLLLNGNLDTAFPASITVLVYATMPEFCANCIKLLDLRENVLVVIEGIFEACLLRYWFYPAVNSVETYHDKFWELQS